jgi:hypothetical protein
VSVACAWSWAEVLGGCVMVELVGRASVGRNTHGIDVKAVSPGSTRTVL